MAKKSFRKTRGSAVGGGRPDRKTLQLCAQVRHALEYAMSGEVNDDLLRMLYVAAVEPAPDADRLMVTVVPLTKDEHPDPAEVITHLHAHAGSLRSAVATAISRRKVPDLFYRFAASDPLTTGDGAAVGVGDSAGDGAGEEE